VCNEVHSGVGGSVLLVLCVETAEKQGGAGYNRNDLFRSSVIVEQTATQEDYAG